MTPPLKGLRLLDVSTILAGPLCCQILGDFGVEVIKVEHPVRGDGLRGHGLQKGGIPLWWKEVGRNKQTVAIDLGKAEGAALFRQMAAQSDVVVENFRPGTLERWGLDPQDLIAENPGLIVVRVTGWGQSGPYSRRPGFGTLAEAMSGFAHLTGPEDAPPTLPAFGLADTLSGLTAAAATLTALYHRDANGGSGQVIDVDLLGPMMMAAGPAPTFYDQLGIVETRHGNRSTNNAPRNTYLTSDGHWAAVSSSAQSVAERVMTLVGHPELIDEPWFGSGHGRAEHVGLIDDHVATWIGARDLATVIDAFEQAGAAVAPVYDARGVVEDPHVRETELLTRVDDDDLGSVLMHNVLWRMSETPGTIHFAGRGIGQDTHDVLGTLCGLTEADVAKLAKSGVVR